MAQGAPVDALRPSAVLAVGRSRIPALDLARALAVVGALAVHALITCDVWAQVPQGAGKAAANAVFRACTPTFFLLFGVLLELVYVRRAELGKPITGRMLGRAGWCYLGLAASALAAWAVGNVEARALIKSLLFIGEVKYASVLRFYAIALVLALLLVRLRCRFGPWVPWALVALAWAADPLLERLPLPESGPGERLRFFWGSLLGHPPVWVGGSVWHNFSLVAVGMGLGVSIRQRIDAGRPWFPARCVAVLAAAGLVVAVWSCLDVGVSAVVQGYAGDSMSLRKQHHPVYYALGGLSALALLALCALLLRGGRRAPRALTALGRHSLVAFAVGSVLVNLVPVGPALSLAAGLALTVAQLAAVWLLVRWLDARAERGR
jgi:hypothetical protein